MEMAIGRCVINRYPITKPNVNDVTIVGGGSNPMAEGEQPLPELSSPDIPAALAAAVAAPVLSRHIAEAIGYRNLDRSDYGTTF